MKLDSHLPFLRERWEAGCHTIAQLHRELVAAGYILSYRLVHKQLARYLPEGRKNPASPVQLARPPVLARHAVFLFLRRPTEELSSEEQETLALLRSLHSEVDQAYTLVQQFANMLRTRTGEQLDDWLSSVRASQNSSVAGVCSECRTRQSRGGRGTDPSPKQWIGRGKSEQAQTHQTYDVWPGRISLVASTCPACFVAYLKGPVHMRYSLSEFTDRHHLKCARSTS
jgi:hypothetical protein